LTTGKFTALRDDKNTFPPYNTCFVVREELLAREPDVAWALGLLRNRVNDEAVQRMHQRAVIPSARREDD
jgi:glycine betaine/choline ABC-type transport system substrate-binding protein